MIVTILDTETSGLIDNGTLPLDRQPEIIELYMCKVDLSTGEVLGEFDQLFKPKKPISDEITKITHITNDMLEGKYTFGHFHNQVQEFVEGSETIIAHNLSYDKEIMDFEFQRLGKTIKWPRLICSVEQSIFLKGYRLNLQGLHELLFGSQFKEAHRARTDVEALTRCCVELYKRGML